MAFGLPHLLHRCIKGLKGTGQFIFCKQRLCSLLHLQHLTRWAITTATTMVAWAMALVVWAATTAVAMAPSEVWAAATVLAMVAMDMAATAHVTMEDTGPLASTEKPCSRRYTWLRPISQFSSSRFCCLDTSFHWCFSLMKLWWANPRSLDLQISVYQDWWDKNHLNLQF